MVDGFTIVLGDADGGRAPEAAGFAEAATRLAELWATAFFTDSAEAVVTSSEVPQAAKANVVISEQQRRGSTEVVRMAARMLPLDLQRKT